MLRRSLIYLSKVEATIAEEEKKIADEYKAEEERQLKDLLLQEKTSCATPTEIINEVESHINDDGAGIYNDVIGLYDILDDVEYGAVRLLMLSSCALCVC